MRLLIFLLIILLFYVINYFILKKNKIKKTYEFYQNNYNNIYFLNKNDLYILLKDNKDKYYERFYGNDFVARKIKNINEYINYIKQSVYDFNDKQKNKIIECINDANYKILKLNNKRWFDINKFNNIPWIIGGVKGKLYENGLPHTRDNIIIMSCEDIDKYDKDKLTKTLIHEKIHIYQKLYKNDCDIYLDENKFTKYKIRNESDNTRANPDLDIWIYKDRNNKIYEAKYIKNPKSIENIIYKPINSQSSEHPFEKMAIEIENEI